MQRTWLEKRYYGAGLIARGRAGLRSDFPLILQHIHTRSKILDDRIMTVVPGVHLGMRFRPLLRFAYRIHMDEDQKEGKSAVEKPRENT